jgi:hypothetical protein
MSKTTTNLLSISIACFILGLAFVTGLVNAQSMVALYVALPLGAVFFGLFLISRMLEKEVSLYDDEHQAHPAVAKGPAAVKEKEATCGCGCDPRPRQSSSTAP